ncbi:hypothetical protein V500_07595 [Pseudogymnoascus sp. VKM F-4518 (FW-2643)]|nr:hypothetical protein V500_07595 [Pseudogymnoascus sp. VKM F-4518 (FW-2643)]
MDSKRKANGAASTADELDDRGAKRRKVSDSASSYGETSESTSQVGLELLETIKNTKDKRGRPAVNDFLTLPSRDAIPDYFKRTKMPIAIDMIEAKLNNREFPTLTSLESYWKRLVQNAKDYNERESLIHKDAERIRKIVTAFMQKKNPAYKDPKYQSFPTPIPGDTSAIAVVDFDAEGESDHEVTGTEMEASMTPTSEIATSGSAKRKPGRPPKNPELGRQQRATSTPSRPDGVVKVGGSFNGLNFQQAQEKIVEELTHYKEDEDDEYPTFEPFIKLPDRKLKDYYQVIPHPVSFNTLRKHIRGSHNKSETIGTSDFKSWDAFEEEVSSIWKNAKHYNEDGSAISALADNLEIFFNKRLAAAKKVVQEPPQQKLKLKVSAPEPGPKIMLRMGAKGSPAESPRETPPNTSTAITPLPNGASSREAAPGTSVRPASAVGHIDRGRSISGSVNSPTLSVSAPVKSEDRPSPSIQASVSQMASAQGLSTTQLNGVSMAPPTGLGPAVTANGHHLNGTTPGYGHMQPSPYQPPPVPTFDSKWRLPGKDASDSMITNLHLSTHPGLHLTRHFHMDLPPSPTMTQQSITINLPHTHYYLQIKPTIADSLMERQHKLFVTSGTQRLVAMPQVPGQPIDHRNPLFEARLLPGVNRIEVELIAALPKGASKAASGQEVELEKVTIFANLLR